MGKHFAIFAVLVTALAEYVAEPRSSRFGRRNGATWQDRAARRQDLYWHNRGYDQEIFRSGIPRWQPEGYEVQGRIDIDELDRCAVFDKKADECFRNKCYFCCSDRYCHPSKSTAPDCFNQCGACRFSEDCVREDCYFDDDTQRCSKQSLCQLASSNKNSCLMGGCFYCCGTMSCHSTPREEAACSKGCTAFCFNREMCENSPLNCAYDISTGQCLPNDDAKYCSYANDLIIIMDESHSINDADGDGVADAGTDNFRYVKEFSARLARTWKMYPNNRVGLFKFATVVTLSVPLNNQRTPDEIYADISNLKYNPGRTDTAQGLQDSRKHHMKYPRKVPKHVVVLTDGVSNENALTVKEVNKLTMNSISSFAVGVGTKVNGEELFQIAMNETSRVFYVEYFNELVDTLLKLSTKICEVSKEYYDRLK